MDKTKDLESRISILENNLKQLRTELEKIVKQEPIDEGLATQVLLHALDDLYGLVHCDSHCSRHRFQGHFEYCAVVKREYVITGLPNCYHSYFRPDRKLIKE